MKFKKVLALGLVGAMTLSLAACGKSSSGSKMPEQVRQMRQMRQARQSALFFGELKKTRRFSPNL